jgi:hypothetical protein
MLGAALGDDLSAVGVDHYDLGRLRRAIDAGNKSSHDRLPTSQA